MQVYPALLDWLTTSMSAPQETILVLSLWSEDTLQASSFILCLTWRDWQGQWDSKQKGLTSSSALLGQAFRGAGAAVLVGCPGVHVLFSRSLGSGDGTPVPLPYRCLLESLAALRGAQLPAQCLSLKARWKKCSRVRYYGVCFQISPWTWVQSILHCED